MARQIVGEIFLNVKPLDGGVSQGVQRIIDSANDQAANIPISAETDEASAAVARLGGQIEEDIGGAWIAAAAQAAAFTAAIVGVRRTVEGLVGQLAGVFDQLAQAQAGFTAILGSEQGGTALLDEIREFARVSPFVTQELVNYSQQLLGVGQSAESIVPLLRSVGDVVASVGGDTSNIGRVLFTLTQIRSIGRLVGQDAIQLQSALIPITKLLADFLGVTTAEVKKLQEQGRISADTVFEALTAAGENVEGAMANATRNIAGARAVLSDTLEILAQDSQGLRQVFDDIVQGILAFSDAIGENQTIIGSIAAIDDAFVRIYESLEPFLEGLASTTSALAISSLQVLTSSLEVLAAVLETIPPEALEKIGQGLALLVALKAPLALLNYVSSIQRLAAAVTPANLAQNLNRVSVGTQQTGQAAEVASRQVNGLAGSMERLSARTQTLRTGFGLAALAAGVFASSLSDGNEAVDTLAGGLQGAGLGAALGGLPGAFIGAGGGIVLSLVSGARAEADARAAELEQIGKEAAESFFRGFNLANPQGFSNEQGFREFFEQIDELGVDEANLGNLETQKNALSDIVNTLLLDTASVGAEQSQELASIFGDQTAIIQRSIDELRPQVDERRALINNLLTESEGAEAVEDLRSRLAELQKESPNFISEVQEALAGLTFEGTEGVGRLTAVMRAFEIATGQASVATVDDFEILEDALSGVGISISTLVNTEIPALVELFDSTIPSAVRETKQELDTTRTAFDEASKGASEFFASFGFQAGALKAAEEQTKKLSEAINTLIFTDGAQTAGFAEALLSNVQSITAANQAVFGDQSRAIADGLSFAATQFEILRSELGLTDAELREFLESLGLLDLFLATSDVSSGFSGTLIRLAGETGLAEEQLREILNISNELERGVQITLTADVESALRDLGRVQSSIGSINDGSIRALEAAESRANQIRDLVALGGARVGGGLATGQTQADIDQFSIQSIRAAERASQSSAEAFAREQERIFEEAAREQGRIQTEASRLQEQAIKEQEQLFNSIESAGSSIESAIEQAADSIREAADSWTASIRERTEFERAVSTSRLLGNTERQVADLDELNRGIEALVSRGLSPDAIGAIGIDNITDLRQVRRLLDSDPTDLRRLSDLIAQRDNAAQILAERQQRDQNKATITAAIVDAARVLGFEISPERVAQITAEINVTGATDPARTGQGILEALLNVGQISRN